MIDYAGTWKHKETKEVYHTSGSIVHQVGWPLEKRITVFCNRKTEPYRQEWSLRHWKHWVKNAERVR